MKHLGSKIILMTFAATAMAQSESTEARIIRGVVQNDARRHEDLHEYSVVRRYTLTDKHSGKATRMSVRMIYQKDHGKTFEVLETSGAQGMQKRVLQKIMDNEAEASRTGKFNQYRINGDNYNLKLVGEDKVTGRPCYVVELLPRHKSKYLLQGRAWVDKSDLAVVRVEGRPTENVSFWVGKPYIVQTFQKVGNYWMAAHNTSLSDSKLLGTHELTIDYSGYNMGGGIERLAEDADQQKRHAGAL